MNIINIINAVNTAKAVTDFGEFAGKLVIFALCDAMGNPFYISTTNDLWKRFKYQVVEKPKKAGKLYHATPGACVKVLYSEDFREGDAHQDVFFADAWRALVLRYNVQESLGRLDRCKLDNPLSPKGLQELRQKRALNQFEKKIRRISHARYLERVAARKQARQSA